MWSTQELAGFLQRHIDVGTDVVGVHLVVEVSLLQLAVHLGRYAGEDNVDALLVVHLDEVGQVVDTRGVDEGNLTHTDNLHLRTAAGVEVQHQIVELVGDAEEVGAVDLVNGTALGDEEVLLVHIHVSVRKKVTSRTVTSLLGFLSRPLKVRQPLML